MPKTAVRRLPVRRDAADPPTTLRPYLALVDSYELHLRAEGKSPRTIDIYLGGLHQFGRFLTASGMPSRVEHITGEHIRHFIADLQTRVKASSAGTRYRALRTFFNWLVAEGELDASPMVRLKEPRPVEAPPDVLSEDQIRGLLKACEGRGFNERRDTALIRMLMETGLRLNEIVSIKLDDVDLKQDTCTVLGKGGRVRIIAFGPRCARDIDRYLRVRRQHPHAAQPWLWLGRFGGLQRTGVWELLTRRAKEAGIGHVRPHQFRHSFAHRWLLQGGQEQDLMHLAGWKTRTMLARYGASAQAERAREAYRRLSLWDV